jgi:hypothetical protein
VSEPENVGNLNFSFFCEIQNCLSANEALSILGWLAIISRAFVAEVFHRRQGQGAASLENRVEQVK